MWGWTKQFTEAEQQQLQEQVDWKYLEEPVLKSWVIEVRDYDTKGMNYLHAVMTAALFTVCCWMYWLLVEDNASLSVRVGTVIGISIGFALLYFAIYSLCFPTRLLVYRMTRRGFEVAGWSRQAEAYKSIFIGTAVVCGIILVMFVAMVPQAFFLLFVGPVGMVLVYINMISNKQMWEAQREFSQKEFEWSEFEKIMLYDERSIIIFEFDAVKRKEKTKYYVSGMFHVFCLPERYEEIITFTKGNTSNIPYNKGWLEIFPETCS